MTLIELKDDAVIDVLPLYSCHHQEPQYFDDYYMGGSTDESFSLMVEFENSKYFSYYDSRSYSLDETHVSNTIRYLFTQPTKFRSMTAEEFKENLKKYLDSL